MNRPLKITPAQVVKNNSGKQVRHRQIRRSRPIHHQTHPSHYSLPPPIEARHWHERQHLKMNNAHEIATGSGVSHCAIAGIVDRFAINSSSEAKRRFGILQESAGVITWLLRLRLRRLLDVSDRFPVRSSSVAFVRLTAGCAAVCPTQTNKKKWNIERGERVPFGIPSHYRWLFHQSCSARNTFRVSLVLTIEWK